MACAVITRRWTLLGHRTWEPQEQVGVEFLTEALTGASYNTMMDLSRVISFDEVNNWIVYIIATGRMTHLLTGLEGDVRI